MAKPIVTEKQREGQIIIIRNFDLDIFGKAKVFLKQLLLLAPATDPQSPFFIFPALKQATNGPSSVPDEPSKHSNKKISSSSLISQRLRSLEKQVKGRKKNKKHQRKYRILVVGYI
ncbi:hypothetical protein CR513_08936, partial [Mucuna pruriens]